MVNPEDLGNSAAIEEYITKNFKNQYLTDYKVGALEYPDGLREKPDLQNYVAFFINTRDKAKTGKNFEGKEHFVSDAKQK